MKYDVIVIGSGPSGLMATHIASMYGKKVLLIEKNNKLGKKLKMTGGGRCNVTNRKDTRDLMSHVTNGKFLYSALNQFGPYDIIDFFENNGVKLKEEDNNRMFPISNKSDDIINLFENLLNNNLVTIKFNTTVKDLVVHDKTVKGVITDNGVFNSNSVIVAVGGKSYPNTGSTGEGYKFASNAGHSLTELYPTETPLLSSDSFIKERTLQGLSLSNVGLKISSTKSNQIGFDILFTHFGLSGPGALRLSSDVYHLLKETENVSVEIDVFPDVNQEELSTIINDKLKANAKKSIKNALSGLTKANYINFLFELIGIDPNKKSIEIKKSDINKLVENLKRFQIKINGVQGFKTSFVTGGGVSIKEIDPKTMESKIINNLYFVGEVLDLHAHTGGYNITIAFSTGYLAGISA